MKYLPTLAVLIFAFVFVPEAYAADSMGFVPCEGQNCSACDFVKLGENILSWLIGVMLVIFTIITALAGFKLVTSGGNPEAKTSAKRMLTNALIGILVVLGAWLLVDTLLRSLLSGGEGEINGTPWSEIECGTQNMSTSVPSSVDPVDLTSACGGSACVSLSIPCKDPNSCMVSAPMRSKLSPFSDAVEAAGVEGARVTEAMPPTRNHSNSCHRNGSCVDYGKAGGLTPDEIIKVINAAEKQGLKPMYEVSTQSEVDALLAANVPAKNIEKPLGGHISAPHFSIYEK